MRSLAAACRLAAIGGLVAIPAVAAGTGATAAARPATVFPGDDWDVATPEEVGLDPAVLEEIALAAGGEWDSNCFAVVRHGRLVGEWYWNDTTSESAQEVFSVTKSFASALVGIAQGNGSLDITQPASDFVTEWQGTESETVTIEDLLSNDSGREWSPGIDYQDMVQSPDRSAFAVGLGQMADVDTMWAYNNSAIQTLSEVVQVATGTEPADFAETSLFAPIGMADTDMTEDGAGNTNMFFGLRSTCRDLLRFGLLYLNGGTWNGAEVVPGDYVHASVDQPSQQLSSSYGYLWWLNRPGRRVNSVVEPVVAGSTDNTVDGQMVDGAPVDMYWASGLSGQWIQVDPGSDTVAVRLGPFGGDFPLELLARVATDGVVD
jgi:CubicO group peptidase (beta-lactamase class C family)